MTARAHLRAPSIKQPNFEASRYHTPAAWWWRERVVGTREEHAARSGTADRWSCHCSEAVPVPVPVKSLSRSRTPPLSRSLSGPGPCPCSCLVPVPVPVPAPGPGLGNTVPTTGHSTLTFSWLDRGAAGGHPIG